MPIKPLPPKLSRNASASPVVGPTGPAAAQSSPESPESSSTASTASTPARLDVFGAASAQQAGRASVESRAAGVRGALHGLRLTQGFRAGAAAAVIGMSLLSGAAAAPAPDFGPAIAAGKAHELRLDQARPNPVAKSADGTWSLNPEFLQAAPGSLRATFDALPAAGAGPAQARLLPDNLDAWNARWDMLEKATTTIDASYFTVTRDAFGHAFLGHLLKKRKEGATVRLSIDAMADAMGKNFKILGRDYLQELVENGADVRIFHPIYQRLPRVLEHSGWAQNHDKILVVDGKLGITGGRNIGSDYFAHPGDMPTAWRDTDVILEGAGAAGGLAKAFHEEVDDTFMARPVGGENFGNWVSREGEMLGAWAMMDTWLKRPALDQATKERLRTDEGARAKVATELVDAAAARLPKEGYAKALSGSERAHLLEIASELASYPELAGSRARYQAHATATRSAETKILDRTSAADPEVNDFTTALVQLAETAQKKLTIQNPYVVLTEPMVQGLERAAKRGVEIEIVTNSPASTDSAVTQAFFLQDWPTVLARVPTAKIFVFTGERKMHAKVAVVDDDVTLVSTFNMDLLSSRINGEVGALMWSKEIASDLRQSIADDRADPRNGFFEYRIRKNDDGSAMLVNGKPVIEQGPADHLSQDVLDKYAKLQTVADKARDSMDQLSGLRLRDP